MMSFQEMMDRVESVEGWYRAPEAFVLYRAALKAGFGKSPLFVELGSWAGRSACMLGLIAQESGAEGKVLAIDQWAESTIPRDAPFSPAEARKRFEASVVRLGLEDVVTMIQEPTAPGSRVGLKAADHIRDAGRSPDLVHIDGGHSKEDIIQDIFAWEGEVGPEGFLVLHDYNDNEDDAVKGVAEARLTESSGWAVEFFAPGISAAFQRIPNGGRGRPS